LQMMGWLPLHDTVPERQPASEASAPPESLIVASKPASPPLLDPEPLPLLDPELLPLLDPELLPLLDPELLPLLDPELPPLEPPLLLDPSGMPVVGVEDEQPTAMDAKATRRIVFMRDLLSRARAAVALRARLGKKRVMRHACQSRVHWR